MSQPETGKVAYTNARLIDPASGLDAVGGLLTEGEAIVDFGPGLFDGGVPADAMVVDCGGHVLSPGLVDMRVQVGEPGAEHKETLMSAGRAAVAGGVTTMVCLPNTNPIIDDEASVEFVARRARMAGLAKVYPYAAATKRLLGEELTEMGMLAQAGALAFTDGIKAIQNTQVMRRALQYAATYDLMVVQHPEDPDLAKGGDMNAGETSTRLGLSGIPVCAETIMLERDIRLTQLTGGRYHAAHVSSAEGLEVIRRAKDKGLKVTCDTAPPYFALNEGEIGDYRTFAKLSPPLRREDDRQAMVAAIKDGLIDAIASDHSPQDEDAKRRPFHHAEAGGVGLETLLAVALKLHHEDGMALIDILRLLTCGPADLLGLKTAGRFAKGAPADLMLFDPNRPWKVDADKLVGKSKNSPFDGRTVQGKVLRTVVDGRTVFGGDD